MSEDVGDPASYVVRVDVEALRKRLTEAAAAGVSASSVLADVLCYVSMAERDMRELAQFRRGELSREPEILVLARAAIAAALKPAPARARRPPAHLLVLVLVWLILVVGPVAEGKLPNELQMMLSTEVGTVSLAIVLTQMMSQKRK